MFQSLETGKLPAEEVENLKTILQNEESAKKFFQFLEASMSTIVPNMHNQFKMAIKDLDLDRLQRDANLDKMEEVFIMLKGRFQTGDMDPATMMELAAEVQMMLEVLATQNPGDQNIQRCAQALSFLGTSKPSPEFFEAFVNSGQQQVRAWVEEMIREQGLNPSDATIARRHLQE